MQGASPLPREQLRGGAARPPAAQSPRARPRGANQGAGVATSGLASGGKAAGAGLGREAEGRTETERQERRRLRETETEAERSRELERGAMQRDEEERAKTRNYREIANKTEARGVHRTMFVILHRDFFSFVIFCNIKKSPPLPQDVLCFSGRVAVFPPPPRHN